MEPSCPPLVPVAVANERRVSCSASVVGLPRARLSARLSHGVSSRPAESVLPIQEQLCIGAGGATKRPCGEATVTDEDRFQPGHLRMAEHSSEVTLQARVRWHEQSQPRALALYDLAAGGRSGTTFVARTSPPTCPEAGRRSTDGQPVAPALRVTIP